MPRYTIWLILLFALLTLAQRPAVAQNVAPSAAPYACTCPGCRRITARAAVTLTPVPLSAKSCAAIRAGFALRATRQAAAGSTGAATDAVSPPTR